jgi:hypothetical protein
LIVGFGAIAFRTFMGYRNARINRDSQRTRNLYFYSLTNNAGTIHTLIRMIAEEEMKEAALAYVAIISAAQPPASAESLKTRIETLLHARFDVEVDFDVEDAIRTLSRLDLWADRPALLVVPPEEAIRRLEEHWRARRADGAHQRCAAEPVS